MVYSEQLTGFSPGVIDKPMTEDTKIVHDGVITAIGDKYISVLVDKEDCHSCRLKEFCGVTDAERNTFRFDSTPYKLLFHRGDRVKLSIHLNAGYEALFWAYIMPFILVAFTIIISTAFGISELWSGIIGLFTLIPYFLILNRSSKSLAKNFKLDLTKRE